MKKIILLIAALAIAPFPALASEVAANPPHHFDVKTVLLDESKHPYHNLSCETYSEDKDKCLKTADVTLGQLLIFALNNTMQTDIKAQIAAWKVMQTLADPANSIVELPADETKLLVDALWTLRGRAFAKGSELPLYEIAEAVGLIDPAAIK